MLSTLAAFGICLFYLIATQGFFGSEISRRVRAPESY